MSVNLKRDNFSLEDLVACGRSADLSAREATAILAEITAVASRWRECAAAAEVLPDFVDEIAGYLRLDLGSGTTAN